MKGSEKGTTNLEYIKSLTDKEMVIFIEGMQSDDDASGYIGCSHCSAYGTHHADKSNIGTKYEYLYECKDCEFEDGLVAWLNKEYKAPAD